MKCGWYLSEYAIYSQSFTPHHFVWNC